MRPYLAAMCIGVLLAATCAWAQVTYKDALIEKYPFYKTATSRFAPLYPALARQIVQDFGVTEGVCVDVGGGCGSLAMALAEITDLRVYMLDIDPWAVRLCNLVVDEAGLTGRVLAYEGDAQDMPFRDEFADLVVSRGSVFFWPDQLAGLRECYRILKPGAVAYIGGGFSRILEPEIRDRLVQWRQRYLRDDPGDGWRPITPELIAKARDAGIRDIEIEREPTVGWWIIMRKPDDTGGTDPKPQS